MTKQELKDLIKECISESMAEQSYDEDIIECYQLVEENVDEFIEEASGKSLRAGMIKELKNMLYNVMANNGITKAVQIKTKFFNKANRDFKKGKGSTIEMSIFAPAYDQESKDRNSKAAFDAITKNKAEVVKKIKEITGSNSKISFTHDSLGWLKIVIELENSDI